MSLRSAAGAKPSQVICEEVFDEDSIATHDEVLEYARRIGIDPEREPHLLHIADEGVNQSLPPGWKPCFEEEKGLLYYFNFRSGESRWEHPLDNMYRQKVILARKQAAASPAAGASPVAGGAEFGRSRRLCAEEEREKKNVSFAPSVHQIEFDLDEEEEEEGEEDEEQEEEEPGDHRARHPLQPLQGASWLREKLEAPGADRLSMLRAAPDRDDSLEMAQDLTEDSQMSLHASEGSDSPRRELERRKEEEVRAALRERRLAEQRRRAQSPSPTPQPPPAAAVVPTPLTPGRLRPLAPVVAPGRGPLAPLPGIGGPPPRPPPGGLAPLAPLGRPALGAVSGPATNLQQKTATSGQSANKPASKPTPSAAQRAEKPVASVAQQRPPPVVAAPAQKQTPTAAPRPEPPSPTAGPRAEKGAEKTVTSSGSHSERPTPAARVAAPTAQRQSEPNPVPVSATVTAAAPAATPAAGPGPGQPPGPPAATYQGGRGRAVSFTERLLARKGVTRPGQDTDDVSTAAKPSSGPVVTPKEAKTSTSATAAKTATPSAVISSAAPTKPTAATTTISTKHPAVTPITVATTVISASPPASGVVKPTSSPAGASLTVDSIPFIDESESSAGSSARAAAAQSRLGAETGGAGGRGDAGMYGGETGTSSSEQSPRQRPETGGDAVAESGWQRLGSVDGDGREGRDGQTGREGAIVQAAAVRGVTSTVVPDKPTGATVAKPRPTEVDKSMDKSATIPQKAEAPPKKDDHSHPESPKGPVKPDVTVAQPPVGGGGESPSPQSGAVQEPASGVVVGGGADRPALPGSVLSISLRNQNSSGTQNAPDTDRERRLRLAAGHSSSGSGSEQDENEIHVGESGELRTGPGRVHSLYPSESDSGSESESDSESDDSESSPDEGEEKENARGSPPAKDQKAQPGVKADASPVVPSDGDSFAKVHVKVASDDTATPKGRQFTRQPSAVDESAASNLTPTTRKSVPDSEPVDNIYLRNTLVNDNARPAVVARRDSKLPESEIGVTEPRETGRKLSDPSRDTRDTIRPQKDSPKAVPVETGVPPADERRRGSSGPADASRDQPDARRPSQTIISAPRGMTVGPAESDLSSDSDRVSQRPAQRGKVWRNRVQSSASEEAPPSSEDNRAGGQGRWVARTSAAGCQTNTEDADWSPTHDRVRSPTDNRRRRSQTDVALQCGGDAGTEGVRLAGDRRRIEPARQIAAAVGREDRAVGPCVGLRRPSPEPERGRVSWEHVSVQTPPPPPAPRSSPRQARTHATCDHRDCEHRGRYGSTARRRPSVLWDTSDADSSDASPRSPPPRPPLPPSAAHRRHSRGEDTQHGRQRAPVTASRSCPQCGRGAAARGGRPTATVSSPALGGGGGGGGGGGRQEPTSPARLAVRQMRHRIKALGMWSEGDGASSDGDPAQLSDSAGAADVRRILARAKHFLHGQAGAASRRRRASELASDSEEPSTDEEERSATERDIQLRAVGRHYRRLKQERSHASDSQLNVRPSSAYQPSRGEQLHSSLAAIHTYRPPPPVRRRPPVPTPPTPPPVPRPRAPKPERSVLERTQELKAWLRKATVAWKLGSLDV